MNLVLKVEVMHLHVHHHGSDDELKTALEEFVVKPILNSQRKIMATQAEHAQQLRDIKDQNEKARAENLAKLQALQDALDKAGNTSPEVDAAMADLKASVQADDDENPDAPPP